MISVVDNRRALLADWLQTETSFKDGELSIASADASFRRYFRLNHNGKSYIVMDAPPELEPSLPFVEIGKWMKNSGINVPEIHQYELDLGFMVLSDFGDFHFQDALESKNQNTLYDLAISEIVQFQMSLPEASEKLPTFNKKWQIKELEIFREWCLPDLPETEYQSTIKGLVEAIDQIPKAFMHRDFHCRNLLVCSDQKLGIIDFQGAMHGPITYDLVSLLRDCYIDNQDEWITKKVFQFKQLLQHSEIPYAQVDQDEFIRWFDFVGLQRHLKCVGIFHRLKIRDKKPEYMKDVPRVLAYIETVLKRNHELIEIQKLVQNATILK
ncbi:MAG: phosphotransferase [Opitutae bacterium]|nr:phosphotransferase [Opitutae bacterium]